jgi:hypothetical protein
MILNIINKVSIELVLPDCYLTTKLLFKAIKYIYYLAYPLLNLD